jgi:hypothetical protein
MRRVESAPNLVIATLWADALSAAGIEARVFSRYLSSIAGEIPPSEAEPTVWVLDDRDLERARQLLGELQRPVRGAGWRCESCGERHGPQFAQCWNCGAARTDPR